VIGVCHLATERRLSTQEEILIDIINGGQAAYLVSLLLQEDMLEGTARWVWYNVDDPVDSFAAELPAQADPLPVIGRHKLGSLTISDEMGQAFFGFLSENFVIGYLHYLADEWTMAEFEMSQEGVGRAMLWLADQEASHRH
jgi:hypothetical protein